MQNCMRAFSSISLHRLAQELMFDDCSWYMYFLNTEVHALPDTVWKHLWALSKLLN